MLDSILGLLFTPWVFLIGAVPFLLLTVLYSIAAVNALNSPVETSLEEPFGKFDGEGLMVIINYATVSAIGLFVCLGFAAVIWRLRF